MLLLNNDIGAYPKQGGTGRDDIRSSSALLFNQTATSFRCFRSFAGSSNPNEPKAKKKTSDTRDPKPLLVQAYMGLCTGFGCEFYEGR